MTTGTWIDGTTGTRPAEWFELELNVDAYGAVGDGVADDSSEFNAALAACSAAGGGTVRALNRIYGASSTINVPSNVRLVGVGKNATIIRKIGASPFDLISFAGTSNASRCQRGGLADLKLDGQGLGGRLTFMKWADHLNIERVWLYNGDAVGSYLENVWDSYFDLVEWDTCLGDDGLSPNLLITSNADDSSNIIVLNECRFENYRDGAVWVSSRPPVSPLTMVTGTNPPYGIYVQNSKMESPQMKGSHIDMSGDVKTFHVDGLYLASRGVASGGPYPAVGVNGADDLLFQRVRAYISGAATISSLFSFGTNGSGAVRDVLVDCANNPTQSVLRVAAGSPDFDFNDIRPAFGQTPTIWSGTWPVQVASAGTITIPKQPPLVAVTGTTTITSITAQAPGRRVTLKFASALTLTDGSNLKLNGDFITQTDATIDLLSDGTNWLEVSRNAGIRDQTILPWVAGRYYGSVVGANAAHTALRLYAYPIWVPAGGRSIDRIGINVTTGVASSAARCLVYAHDPVTGGPGALLFDPGADLATTSATAFEHTVAWTLPEGIVWLAMETNANGTFSTNQTHPISLYSQLVGHGSIGANGQGIVTTGAITFGAGPTPFPTYATSAVCPVIRVRAA